MNLILFGFKGCGKTTIGQQLAAQLHCTFIDTDHLIEKKGGKPVREIVLTFGFDRFLKLEQEAVASLKGVSGCVIAVGGGTVLNPENLNTLEKLGTLVYLQASKETLKRRMLRGELPTFLDPKDPEGSFEKMYAARKEFYEQIPAVRIDAEGEWVMSKLQEIYGK
jgi:shikimate kinase